MQVQWLKPQIARKAQVELTSARSSSIKCVKFLITHNEQNNQRYDTPRPVVAEHEPELRQKNVNSTQV